MALRNLLLAAAGLALVPLAANADPKPAAAAPHSRDAFIADYDVNHDGQVTKAEFEAVRRARFKAADTDGDGVLSEAEYVAEYEGRLKAQYAGKPEDEQYARQIKQAHVRFHVLNTSKDGKLTFEQYHAQGDKTFAEFDTNKDGVVSAADPLPAPRPAPAAKSDSN